jgi:hypothetical protein
MTEPERRAAELRTLMARLDRQRTTLERVGARIQRAAARAAHGDAEAAAATALHLQLGTFRGRIGLTNQRGGA